MRGSVKQFINGRIDPVSLTNYRIREIMNYFVYCYGRLTADSITYSKKWIKENTAFGIEDFLKMKFVDDYLIVHKEHLQASISALDQINFSYETQKRYVDINNIERSDKIDVYINKLGLRDVWDTADEHLYLAVECKRIKSLSDNGAYFNDIKKFCNRNYIQMRLPFEGMMAFVENKNLSSAKISTDLNQRLNNATDITTTQLLKPETISTNFNSGYHSVHIRNGKNENFGIYHLYFDYSGIILS